MNMQMDGYDNYYEIESMKPNWIVSLISLLVASVFIAAVATGIVNVDGSNTASTSELPNHSPLAERLRAIPREPVMTFFLVESAEQYRAVMAEQMAEADLRYGLEQYRFNVLLAGNEADLEAATLTINETTRRWMAIDSEARIAVVDLRAPTENDH